MGIRPTAVVAAVFIAGMVYALTWASPYDQRVLTLAGVFALLVLGYHLVFGHAGVLNLAQGAFFGLGAYTTGILGSNGVPFAATFPLSIVTPVVLAALTGLVVLRLQTHYFALASLAVAQLLLLLAVNWQSVTGGANGIVGVPPISLLGFTARSGPTLMATVWLCVLAGAIILHLYLRGSRRARFAIAATAPATATASGINVAADRLAAFVVGAGFAGAAGALYAHTIRVVSPDVLGFSIMISCLAMTVIGGRKSIIGVVIGALLLTVLPEILRPLQDYYLAAAGGATLLAVIFAPLGIAGLFVRPALPARLPAHRATPHPAPATASPSTALTITGVSKSFGGVAVLTGMNMQITGGEIVGLIGPNGSGKTTLVNLISGFERPGAGTIRLAGHDVTRAPPHAIAAAGFARSFQTPEMPDDLTPVQVIALAGPDDLAWRRRQSAAAAALAAVGLASVADTPCSELPHGQRVFVDVLRALASPPSLLVLDEPAAGLGDRERAALTALVRQTAAAGTAVIVIEHNVDFLEGLANRLICIDLGRVIADGPLQHTITSPAVRQAYYGDAP